MKVSVLYVGPDGRERTAEQWARRLGIKTFSFYRRVWKYGAADPRVFTKGRVRPSVNRVFRHPVSGAVATHKQWAKRMGIKPGSFLCRVSVYGPDDVRTFTQKRPEVYYTDPETGKSRTVTAWVKRLGISRQTFRVRIRKYGPDDRRTYLKRKKAV